MSLNVVKTTAGGSIPIFQKVDQLAQGGFALDVTGLVSGSVIKKGTPLYFDEATRKAVVVKTAIVQADATDSATAIRVIKGHSLAVADIVGAESDGAKDAITAITTTESAYDQITVGTTLGVALTAGDVIFQAAGTAASSGAALKATPNGMLYEDVTVDSNVQLGAVIRGTVYKRRIPNGVHALVQAALEDNIIFSNSF